MFRVELYNVGIVQYYQTYNEALKWAKGTGFQWAIYSTAGELINKGW